MTRFQCRFDAEDGSVVLGAIDRMKSELPRDATATDEQFAVDALVEIVRRYATAAARSGGRLLLDLDHAQGLALAEHRGRILVAIARWYLESAVPASTPAAP